MDVFVPQVLAQIVEAVYVFELLGVLIDEVLLWKRLLR